MIPRDKLTLRNLIMVILASTTLALLVGISCLGRWHQPAPPETAQSASGLATVGTTTITSAESQGGSATGTPEVIPRASPPRAPTQTQTPPEPPTPTQTPTPAPSATPAPRFTVQVVVPPPPASSPPPPATTVAQSPIPPDDGGPPSPDDGGPPDLDAGLPNLSPYGILGPFLLTDASTDASP